MCKKLASIRFAAESKLSRLEKEAFYWSALQSIVIPASVEVICESCFSMCKSLAEIAFHPDSRLPRLPLSKFLAGSAVSCVSEKEIQDK
jgi:hypothetical protein